MARITISTFIISTFILLFFASCFIANPIPGDRTNIGGRTKVKDVKKNTEIQKLGKYAVDEHNKSQHKKKTGDGDLKFSKVIEAETQLVSGTKYYLKIEASTKSGDRKVYDAEVLVKPWVHFKQLLSFKPSSKKN